MLEKLLLDVWDVKVLQAVLVRYYWANLVQDNDGQTAVFPFVLTIKISPW